MIVLKSDQVQHPTMSGLNPESEHGQPGRTTRLLAVVEVPETKKVMCNQPGGKQVFVAHTLFVESVMAH
ncbi:hypothetical protein ACFQU0_18060 [Hydrogenophaga defluvii]|uniref:Uncharacterized protein n=1 Tax=Hydrogenophaga defluvii TaxID=249410 RepID=A0ABW2SFP0_9BURK